METYLKDFRGTTLLVTHDLEEAYRLCDKILIIRQGRAEAFGSREDIFRCSPIREVEEPEVILNQGHLFYIPD